MVLKPEYLIRNTCRSTIGFLMPCMMMSSNGNIFRVTGLCVGNSPVIGEFPAQRPVMRSFDISLICAWINGWANTGEAGHLRRHRAHNDVTLMPRIITSQAIISYGNDCTAEKIPCRRRGSSISTIWAILVMIKENTEDTSTHNFSKITFSILMVKYVENQKEDCDRTWRPMLNTWMQSMPQRIYFKIRMGLNLIFRFGIQSILEMYYQGWNKILKNIRSACAG